MNWISNVVRPKIRNMLARRDTPENLWIKCPESGQLVFYKDVEANQFVIPSSNYHMRMGAVARMKSIFDGEVWDDIAVATGSIDPLKFRDERRYADRLKDARTKTGLVDAIKVGHGRLEGTPVTVGVQDFDLRVQQAVNRVQPFEMTEAVMLAARAEGYKSVSVDLIYGLPHQSVESFSHTLDTIIGLAPDRLSVFGYAHMPSLFKMQRHIDETALPSPAVRLAILERVIEKLTGAGYAYIGMDHFALPTDELAIAQRAGTLQRNFQGYSTQADCDLIGLGVSSISKVGDVYAQNAKDMAGYGEAIDRGELAITRGVQLNADDRMRRDVIAQLMCQFSLRFDAIEAVYGIRFPVAFASELERLKPLEADGLVEVTSTGINVLADGRMLVRNVAMIFDRYLGTAPTRRFSRII